MTYLAELAAHAWDLARATGQLGKLDPSLALPALEGARAMIKPQYRNMVEPGMGHSRTPTQNTAGDGFPADPIDGYVRASIRDRCHTK